MFMILWNYDSYYSTGKTEFAREFFALCDDLGIEYYGESASINSLKAQYGL